MSKAVERSSRMRVIKLESTNRSRLEKEKQAIQKGVRSLVKDYSSIMNGPWPTRTTGQGNRNLTLNRSPHGNKTHRDTFVPRVWKSNGVLKVWDLRVEDLNDRQEKVSMRVRSQGAQTLVGFELICTG